MSLIIILRLLGGILFIATNAFFVVTEFSFTRLRPYDNSEFKDDPDLKRAWKMTEKTEKREIYLTSCFQSNKQELALVKEEEKIIGLVTLKLL